MPFGDATGPNGAGPGTGRGLGPCVGNNQLWRSNRRFWGFGRGFGRRFWGRFAGQGYRIPDVPPEDEAAFLNNEISLLEKEKGELETRLKEIQKEK